MTFLLNLLTALAGAAVLAEIMARAGAVPAVFVRHIPRSALEECGVGFLLGIHAFGTLLLGLAACGLFRPVPLALFLLAAVAIGSCVRGWRRSAALAALGELPRPVLLMVPFLLAAAIPVVLGLVIPSLEQDSYEYHLAFGWRCLQTGKVTGGLVPYVFHLPLPVDLAGSLGLPFGEERVGQWVAAGCWLAAGLVFMGRLVREERTLAGFAGLLLPLAAVSFTYLMASGKNDIPAAACFVAGALLWRRGGSVVGALLLGCAVAGKFVYGPLVAMWVVVNLPGRRKLVPVLTAVVLPTLPWWVKTFLYTGNPIYPFGWQYIPSFGWDSMNDGAMMAHARGFFHPDALTVQSIPKGWFRHFLSAEPHQLVVVPILLALSATRRRTLAVLGGQFVTMAMGHMTRYLLPGGWLFDLMAVGEALRLKGKVRLAVLWLAVAAGAGYAFWNSLPVMSRWPDLGRTVAENRAFRLTTYQDATNLVASRGYRSLLCIGELRTFRIPGRCVFGGVVGETPVMWKLARESRDREEFAKKVRQLGIGEALYNLVGAVWVGDRYSRFPWSDRDLAVYQGYMAAYCSKVERISKVEEGSGGFYLYTFSRRAGRPAREVNWFLPGSENVNAEGLLCERRLQFVEGTRAYLAGLARIPKIGQAMNLVGHGYLRLRDVAAAEKYLAPFAKEGMADLVNLLEYATVLMEQGKYEEAVKRFEECEDIYPGQRDPVDINLSWSYCQLANARLLKGNEAEAIRLVGLAEALAFRPGGAVTGAYASPRKVSKSMVLGTRGEIAWRRGDRARAAEWYRKALAADPGGKLEGHWQSRLTAVEGRTSPAGGIFGR